MTISLKEIRSLEATRWPTPTKLVIENPPIIPTGLTVTGQQGLIRTQWAPVFGVDGYDVAIMTTQNLATPDVTIERKIGDKCREHVYSTGNVAITRYFAVRSFIAGFYSDWSAPVSGTSAVFGAVESAPPAPPSNPPSSSEPPPSGSGLRGKISLL